MTKVKRLKSVGKKAVLLELVDSYFDAIKQAEANGEKGLSPTLTGLALHLGFVTKDDFEDFETSCRNGWIARQARLKIMAYYESRLLLPSPTGAIFALKSMGWDEKAKTTANAETPPSSIKIKVIETGPQPASAEKEIVI